MSSINFFFFLGGELLRLRMLLKAARAGSGEWNVCSQTLFFSKLGLETCPSVL